MQTLSILIVFVFGTIIGSFLNVVVLRYKTGRRLTGRSGCFTCGKKLAPLELIPLLSFFFQGGKCTGCSSKISLEYPLVEGITGLVFATIYTCFSAGGILLLIPFAFFAFIFSLLIVISSYDIKHKIIPDVPVYFFIGASFFWMIFAHHAWYFKTIYGSLHLLAGPIIALPFAAIWYLSRGRAMGFGDAKIALGAGWLLGLVGGVSAVVLSFWIGAAVTVLKMIYDKLKRRTTLHLKSEIPFGPFLALGIFLQFLFSFDFFRLKDFIDFFFL